MLASPSAALGSPGQALRAASATSTSLGVRTDTASARLGRQCRDSDWSEFGRLRTPANADGGDRDRGLDPPQGFACRGAV